MEESEVESENEDEMLITDDDYPRTKVVKVKKKKTRRRLPTNVQDIDGVRKIVLGEISQKVIGCVVGENVTSEKPWIYVEKENIMSNLELHAESSEFLPIKAQLDVFPRNEVLIGYIPNETRDYDEFYICLTETAADDVKEIIDQQRIEQEKRLQSSVIKMVRPWTSQGSEVEIDESRETPNRALLEVEIESKYPILPFKVRFCKKKCQEMRDGYMELHGIDPATTIVTRKRIDNFTQVAPFLIPNEAQTDCKYPTNEACQYQYEYEVPKDIDFQPFIGHWNEYLNKFLEVLISNAHLDLYLDDYNHLKINLEYQRTLDMAPPKEYSSFIDVNICKGKQISAAKWHPLWSGVAAIAYVDVCLRLWAQNPEMDENVNRLVHKMNPVLLWSFADDLKPKLVLETHREVATLSFCPFDENILVGGCSNGQILIWDLKNRLQKVEEREILTVAQQKYKRYMFSLMQWMKNVFDVALVKPTVITQLEYSHKAPISTIEWVSPYYKYSKTGKVEFLENGHSMQFMTASEDGTILIWDLHSKPTGAAMRGPGKLHRVKAKPTTEIPEQSPYKCLNLNMKPIYKINIALSTGGRLIPISTLGHKSMDLVTKKRPVKKEDLRETYDIVFKMPQCSRFQNDAYIGTIEGDFFHVQWEGQKFDSGEVVNKEDCIIKNGAKYHDGPVTGVSISPTSNVILTVGGKIFALWRQDFKNLPILWRKGKSIYTYGLWSTMEPSKICLLRMDGFLEIWFLCYTSNKPIYTMLVSTGPITSTSMAIILHKSDFVFSLADHTGCLRSYKARAGHPDDIKNDNEKMNRFIAKEIQRKKLLIKWQDDWNEKHRQTLSSESQQTLISQDKSRKSLVVKDEESTMSKKEDKSKNLEQSPAQRYVESIKEQEEIRLKKDIEETVFERKQIKKKQLDADSVPLKKAQEEAEKRKRKIRRRINESEKVFNETITMLFPDVVKEKPPPPVDPYITGHPEFNKKNCYDYYEKNSKNWKDFVQENPFQYVFNWRKVLKTGDERRKRITGYYDKTPHWRRIEKAVFDEDEIEISVISERTISETSRPSVSMKTTEDNKPPEDVYFQTDP